MKKLLAVLVLILAAGFGGYALFHAEKPDASYGAAVGPDQIGSDHYSWNGIVIYPYHPKMNTGSTTLCSIKSPSATTTLKSFVVNFRSGTTTASTVYLAKGTTVQATTTNFETIALGANAIATVIASTTGRTLNLPVIAPNSWLNVGQSGGTGTFSPTGDCTVELQGV